MEKYLKETTMINSMERLFEKTVNNYVKQGLNQDQINFLTNYLDLANNDNHDQRFTAFFTLFSLYRREYNNASIDKLFKKYREEFKDLPLFTHADLLRLSMISHSRDDLKEIMDKSKRYINDLENKCKDKKLNHTGILHYYAHAVCNYYEVSDYDYKYEEVSQNKSGTKVVNENIELAKEVIEICINNEKDYAKFYATKGRICLLNKDFDEAINNFLIAKAKEDPTRKDYRLIIGGYQDYLLFAKQLKQANILMEQNKTLETNIKDIHAGNIRLISLFTGLITLVIGNLSVITSNDEPVKLMFLFNGMFFIFFGVIIVFTNILLGHYEDQKKNKGLNLLSLLLILAGLLILGWFFSKEML